MKKAQSIAHIDKVGRPLSPWTYSNREVFDLEYQTLFLRRWQLVGHVNDVADVGDFMTLDLGRDSVVVLRGKDYQLRAFLNVCRHRASRIFAESGTCRGVVRCPYHGWTYQLDGSLMAIPQEEQFPKLDKSKLGLHAIEVEIFCGLVFVRVENGHQSVAEQFAHTAHYFEKYDVENYVRISDPSVQIWEANWKIAWDNYQENYHIPIGHPGLHRLVKENDEWDELDSGINFGVFVIRDKPSRNDDERRYQELLHHADRRLPEELAGKWVQFGMSPNLGIDLYPEMLDTFQLIPIGHERTLVRTAFYGHQNPTAEESELRTLNMSINDAVNEEDKVLCARVQKGMQTHRYRPGPLSQHEGSLFSSHEMIRNLIPVMALEDAPPCGTVSTTNQNMLAER